MSFVPFELEEWQSRWETTVLYNLADSGVHSLRLEELLGEGGDGLRALDRLLAIDLHYPPVGGTDGLRATIAGLFRASPGDVLVTVGAAEANHLVVSALVEPGDHAVVMEPGYRQVWGSCKNRGAIVDAFALRPDRGWRPDLDQLAAVVRPDTRLIAVTNPNNPVGTILTPGEMARIADIAAGVGAWLLADEVYRGTERLTDRETPSFWGSYDKVISVGSLSKAYGLPGLRLGWLVAPPELVQRCWRRHEYAAISASGISMLLAERALAEPMRSMLLARTRRYIRGGYATLERWASSMDGLVSLTPPEATALAFPRIQLDLPSLTVATALRERARVLVGAGSFFGVEQHLRLTHGLAATYLDAALDRVGSVLRALRREGG